MGVFLCLLVSKLPWSYLQTVAYKVFTNLFPKNCRGDSRIRQHIKHLQKNSAEVLILAYLNAVLGIVALFLRTYSKISLRNFPFLVGIIRETADARFI